MNWIVSILKAFIPTSPEQVVAQRDLLLRAANAIGELINIARSIPVPKSQKVGLMNVDDPVAAASKIETELREELKKAKGGW